MAMQRRQAGTVTPAEPAVLGNGPGILEMYPDLTEFLTAVRWPDGTARETGTAMVFVEAGAWKVWLHDRDAHMGCFVSGHSLEGALAAAEGAVAGQSGDWRPDRKKGRGGS
jgi:hypothetical protein